MTVLVREDLNESDLLWAAADLAVAGTQDLALRARVAAARLAPGFSAAAAPAAPQNTAEVAWSTP